MAEAISGRDKTDPHEWIRDATDDHRAEHHCWAYPYQDATILGVIGSLFSPARVLELGTALGYTACWWAHGEAEVTTIEADRVHVQQARDNVAREELSSKISVQHGDFLDVMRTLKPEFNLIFFDGYAPSAELLAAIQGLLLPNGVLVLTNLDLGAHHFSRELEQQKGWQTQFVGDLAVCSRLPES